MEVLLGQRFFCLEPPTYNRFGSCPRQRRAGRPGGKRRLFFRATVDHIHRGAAGGNPRLVHAPHGRRGVLDARRSRGLFPGDENRRRAARARTVACRPFMVGRASDLALRAFGGFCDPAGNLAKLFPKPLGFYLSARGCDRTRWNFYLHSSKKGPRCLPVLFVIYPVHARQHGIRLVPGRPPIHTRPGRHADNL